ncbi:trans-sulfuration enzyme family protein [Methylophaga thiooxydans]|uniref:trans-sulfuration enzyme family protein n=1 Tax=Methylophaga thiooxydans TaxID=392484 RepID=UPI0023541C49|nr:aminotransferase class I/II-fold pyridoxal phosphate-dependent enzyme [Methylophaga thiooxydans]
MSDFTRYMTTAIHAGNTHDAHGSPFTPLYDTTTFCFEDTEALLDVVEGREQGALYTRYGMNPTVTSLEQRLAQLDQAEAALAFASGMAAISSLCLAFGQKGIVCLGEIYGGTVELLTLYCEQLNINTTFLRADDKAGLENSLQQGASMVLFETPANPTLAVIDIKQVAELAHQHDALVAVDNTFATPINQQPLSLGADFSVQSATKYLGGHSDLTAGVLSGSRHNMTIINGWRKSLGQTISAEIAHKLKRSLMTLPLRVESHNQNALIIARFLEQHPAVETVYYPGLVSHPGHAIANKQMQGYGGMLSFDVRGGDKAARQCVDTLKLIALAPSLGGAESLATQPVTTSHHGMSDGVLRDAGISGAMIRLSVGLETASDLINDFEQAFIAIR